MLTSQAAPTPIAITPSPTPERQQRGVDDIVPEHGRGEVRPDVAGRHQQAREHHQHRQRDHQRQREREQAPAVEQRPRGATPRWRRVRATVATSAWSQPSLEPVVSLPRSRAGNKAEKTSSHCCELLSRRQCRPAGSR